jgi:hypothetical protein
LPTQFLGLRDFQAAIAATSVFSRRSLRVINGVHPIISPVISGFSSKDYEDIIKLLKEAGNGLDLRILILEKISLS